MNKPRKRKTVVSAFRLPEETWKAIRHRAIEEHRRYTEVITQALDEYCAKPIKETSRGAA